MTTTLESPSVCLQSPVSTVYPSIPIEDTRPKFHEAYRVITEGSQLKRIIDGKEPPHQWPNAINQDVQMAYEFIRTFARDIEIITGRRIKVEDDRFFNIAFSRSTSDLKGRLETLHKEFINCVESSVSAMRSRLVAVRDKKWGWVQTRNNFFSVSEIEIFGKDVIGEPSLDVGGAVAKFQHLGVDHRVYNIKFAEPCFKSIDDFTRSIPKHAQRKVDRLKQTTFNYEPKILDGVLIEESEEESITAFKDWVEYMNDPALTIRCDQDPNKKTRYAVDFWKEPYDSDLKRFGVWAINSPIIHLFTIWLPMAFCLAVLANLIGWTESGFFGRVGFVVCGIGAALTTFFSIFTYALPHTILRNRPWRL